jgi:hypothetical protein
LTEELCEDEICRYRKIDYGYEKKNSKLSPSYRWIEDIFLGT